MKTIILALFLFIFSGCENSKIVVTGNIEKRAIEFEKGKVRCSECGMLIKDYKFSAQIITPDAKTYFFSDVGSFIEWIHDKEFEERAVIWVYSNDTGLWIDARKAFYSDNDITPMGYGFGAYENKREGFIDYETVKERVLRGEDLRNPAIRKKILKN